jgi:phosphoribosylamine---glycine ligase
MKLLVIGGGGREHALIWKLAQSRQVTKLFCAPGNAGIAAQAECVPIAATDIPKLVAFAEAQKIDLTVVGPEAPLCAGIVDAFQAKGLRVFGPNLRAARMEGSKVFSKQVMLKSGVPTARAEIFDNAAAACAYLRKSAVPVVVKADGLAAGKGVIVAQSIAEAEQAVTDIMVKKVFGAAGNLVVIEDCLQGEEVSVMALVDGKTFRVLATAQDHKRVFDNDQGPNTGGMGAYSPTPTIRDEWRGRIDEVFERTLAGLRGEGIEFRGVLYAGFMVTADGPQVLEFNARFGDPETQVVLPRMDFDLVDACLATAEGRLDQMELKWKKEAAVCIVLAAGGYPGDYARGKVITGLKGAGELANVAVFHAGTKPGSDGAVVTDGGRVLGVTAWGDGIAGAVDRAYEAVAKIHFDGMQYRRDIAARALRKS